MSNYDGQMSEFYNRDKDELYEIKDADARSDISDLQQNKVDKVSGKGLSTNDYTTEEKNKLSGIEMYADDNNVWFCIVDSVEFTENTYVDYYMHAVNRNARWTGEAGRERFIDGDIFFVFFNGVDIDQLGVNPPYYLVRFFIEETPSQTSEKHPYIVNVPDSGASSQALNYWNPYSLRTFVFKKTYSGNALQYSLIMAYSAARNDNTLSWQITKGEVSLSDSLDFVSHSVAATSYAVKRLKDMIDSIGGGTLSYEVVQTLPIVPNISTTTMYLLPKQTAGTQNVYDEYLNPTGLNDGWELLGDTEIDLSNYYTKTETDTLIGGKVDKVTGKGLSTEDYTTAEKNKLSGIATGAEVNVQIDWNQSDSTADDYLKNKPTIPTALSDLSDDSTHRVVTDTEKSTWSGKVSDNPTFSEASTRANIASGESFATILGKIKKFFTDLKTVAFTGEADDVSYVNTTSGLSATDVQGAIDELNSEKQETLVSGTNIKTINGYSLLGSGGLTTVDTWRPVSVGGVTLPEKQLSFVNTGNVSFSASPGTDETNLSASVSLKTVNGNSLIGSGDITTPSGVDTFVDASLPSTTGTDFSGYSSGRVICPANVAKSIGTVEVAPGYWLLEISAMWYSNGTGYRMLGLSTTKNTFSTNKNYTISQNAVNGVETYQRIAIVVHPTTATRYHIIVKQNVGDIYVSPEYKAIRLEH